MAARSTSALKAPAGLQARMLLTFFGLGAVYVILIGVLIAAKMPALIVFVGVLFVVQLTASEKLGLRAMGAHEVSPQQAPELHAIVERLCIQADIPKPKVGIVQTQMPNAFAMGRSQKSATVCVTTGLLQLLNTAELEGVIAHELAHIRHRDVAIMTIASFFAAIASMILQFGFLFGGGGNSRDNDNAPSTAVVILVALVVYAVSFVLMQALSRYREFAADRGAAEITRRPSALASALMKISGGMDRIPQEDLRRNAHSELAAFYIESPSRASVFELLATHPPTEKRIAALAELERQLQAA